MSAQSEMHPGAAFYKDQLVEFDTLNEGDTINIRKREDGAKFGVFVIEQIQDRTLVVRRVAHDKEDNIILRKRTMVEAGTADFLPLQKEVKRWTVSKSVLSKARKADDAAAAAKAKAAAAKAAAAEQEEVAS